MEEQRTKEKADCKQTQEAERNIAHIVFFSLPRYPEPLLPMGSRKECTHWNRGAFEGP